MIHKVISLTLDPTTPKGIVSKSGPMHSRSQVGAPQHNGGETGAPRGVDTGSNPPVRHLCLWAQWYMNPDDNRIPSPVVSAIQSSSSNHRARGSWDHHYQALLEATKWSVVNAQVIEVWPAKSDSPPNRSEIKYGAIIHYSARAQKDNCELSNCILHSIVEHYIQDIGSIYHITSSAKSSSNHIIESSSAAGSPRTQAILDDQINMHGDIESYSARYTARRV